MAALVKGDDGHAGFVEGAGDVMVTAAVFAKTVDETEQAHGRALGEPLTAEQLQPIGCGEGKFEMVHGYSLLVTHYWLLVPITPCSLLID